MSNIITTVQIAHATIHPEGLPPGDPITGYLRAWLPILGPTSTLAFHELHTMAAPIDSKLRVVSDLQLLAEDLGVGHKGGKNAPVQRAIKRLYQFGFIGIEVPTEADPTVTLRITELIPRLNNRSLNRLRPALAQKERELASQATE